MTVVCTKCGVVAEGRPGGKCAGCGAEWALIPAWRAVEHGPSASELHAEAVAHLTERSHNDWRLVSPVPGNHNQRSGGTTLTR